MERFFLQTFQSAPTVAFIPRSNIICRDTKASPANVARLVALSEAERAFALRNRASQKKIKLHHPGLACKGHPQYLNHHRSSRKMCFRRPVLEDRVVEAASLCENAKAIALPL